MPLSYFIRNFLLTMEAHIVKPQFSRHMHAQFLHFKKQVHLLQSRRGRPTAFCLVRRIIGISHAYQFYTALCGNPGWYYTPSTPPSPRMVASGEEGTALRRFRSAIKFQNCLDFVVVRVLLCEQQETWPTID